jgi:hypothetical protein
MRLTRAAPAGTTSSSTPPISRIVAPGIGATSASKLLRVDMIRGTGLRAVLRAGCLTAFRGLAAFAFFAFFAMRELVAQFQREDSMTRRAVLALLLTQLAALQPVVAQAPNVVGTWRLVSYDTQTPDGVKTFPLGQDLEGLAIYLPNGRVSIQFMRRDRPLFKSGDAWRGTLEEERAAFEGFFGYAGRYTLDVARSTVTHHLEIASAPNYVGIDLVRTFSFSGDRLTLRTPPRTLAGQTSVSTLVWERIN